MQLNAPTIAASKAELLDILWHLSEWTKAQEGSPDLTDAKFQQIREQLSHIAGELQAVQLDISKTK